MKAMLFSNGVYEGMESVNFPVEVEVSNASNPSHVFVTGAELKRVGADVDFFDDDFNYLYYVGSACAVIGEEGEMKEFYEDLAKVLDKHKVAIVSRSNDFNDSEIGFQSTTGECSFVGRHHITAYDCSYIGRIRDCYEQS